MRSRAVCAAVGKCDRICNCCLYEYVVSSLYNRYYAEIYHKDLTPVSKKKKTNRTVDRANCIRYKGHDAQCRTSGTLYMIIFGMVEIVLSQFPNLEKITLISVVAAIMSFAYSSIALALSIAKFASHRSPRGTLLGVEVGGASGVASSTKVWHSFQAIGNIALAYSYSMLLVEIQVVSTTELQIYDLHCQF